MANDDPGRAEGGRPPVNPGPQPAREQSGFPRHWLMLCVALLLIVLVLVFHKNLATPSVFRECFVLALAAGLLYSASRTFLPRSENPGDPNGVRFVIAFDAVVFIVVGLAATILACANWAAALLLCGASLLTGGFFGLLFGYPQGVAQQTEGQAGQPAPNRDKTLLAQSAITLGKVLAGFTLAKISPLLSYFWRACGVIGPLLGASQQTPDQPLAAVIIAYFFATGFFSGLLLPPYFMGDKIGG
jgi:hypothetical protein